MNLRTVTCEYQFDPTTFESCYRITLKKDNHVILNGEYNNQIEDMGITKLDIFNLILKTINEPPLTDEEFVWHQLTTDHQWK